MALLLGLVTAPLAHARNPFPTSHLATAAEAAPKGDLHDKIADDIRGMNAAGNGIFNEDISAIVGAYFPAGETFDETQRLARRQHLQPLKLYAGRQHASGTMYVTRFDMTKAMFSSVFVAVYFTFARNAAGQQVLTKTDAFLRASDM